MFKLFKIKNFFNWFFKKSINVFEKIRNVVRRVFTFTIFIVYKDSRVNAKFRIVWVGISVVVLGLLLNLLSWLYIIVISCFFDLFLLFYFTYLNFVVENWFNYIMKKVRGLFIKNYITAFKSLFTFVDSIIYKNGRVSSVFRTLWSAAVLILIGLKSISYIYIFTLLVLFDLFILYRVLYNEQYFKNLFTTGLLFSHRLVLSLIALYIFFVFCIKFFSSIYVVFLKLVFFIIKVPKALVYSVYSYIHFLVDLFLEYERLFSSFIRSLTDTPDEVINYIAWMLVLKFILLVPLLLFIILFFFVKTKDTLLAGRLIYFLMWFLTVNLLFLIRKVLFEDAVLRLDLGIWFSCGGFEVHWGFLFDTLSVTMLFIIITISFVVQMYSIMYMLFDRGLCRFLSYLALFLFFMIILVSADNLLVLFVGWEGVGVCSFLLISYWSTRVAANRAAFKAFIINRLADVGLLISLVVSFNLFGSVNYDVIFSVAPKFQNATMDVVGFSVNPLAVICCALLFGAAGKSAQLGFHLWLPDAMEGPTPVSALIHAATMVTAGIFLIIRCSSLFSYFPNILYIAGLLGALTSLFGASVACVQTDIKKIIAYSTCSQLGLMFMACGVSQYYIALFHFVNHAFFKALLFLCAGLVIRGLRGEQDIRRMGGLINKSSELFFLMFIASLSLMGFPFFSGFFSKEAILNTVFLDESLVGGCLYLCGLITTFLTSVYSVRLLYFVFFGEFKGSVVVLRSFTTMPTYLRNYLYFLAIGSVFSGVLLKDFFIGFGVYIFQKTNPWLINSSDLNFLGAEFLPWYIRLIPFIFSLLGAAWAYCYYFLSCSKISISISASTHRFLTKAWGFNVLLNNYCLKLYPKFIYKYVFLYLDKQFLEIFGYNGFRRLIDAYNKFLYNYWAPYSVSRQCAVIVLFFFYCIVILKLM